MPKIFVTHASKDDLAAEALRAHLVSLGWPRGDVFLDHSVEGIGAHEQWKTALGEANSAANALVCLASPEWLASKDPQVDRRVAETLKGLNPARTRGVLIAVWRDLDRKALVDAGLGDYHTVNLAAAGDRRIVKASLPARTGEAHGRQDDIPLNETELAKLVRALRDIGAAPDAGAPLDSSWLMPAASPPPRKWHSRAPKPDPYGQRAAIDAALADVAADAPIRTLRDSQAFADRLEAYERANVTAVRAQTWYKRWGGVALMLATLATLIAAASLLPVRGLFPGGTSRYVSGLQAASNVLTLAIVWWLGRAGAIDRWLTSRAEAERLRGQLFADLLSAPMPPGADPKRLWREKLALVTAAHVDYQRRYFASAVKKHTKAAGGLSRPRALALLATACSIVIGGFAFFDLWPHDLLALVAWLKLAEEPVQWQLALGTLASALLAYASARTLIHQDERNAALYRHTGRRLDELVAAQGKAAEDAATRGDGVAVIDYAQAAQAILDADYTAWQFHRPPRDPTSGPPHAVKR